MSCKVYLMCVRLIQNRMELFSTAEKLFVWQLRLRHKKHCHPIADTGYTKSKICFPLQIFGYCMRYWAFRWQRHSKTTVMSISCSKQLRASFSRCLTQWKIYFFVPSLCPGIVLWFQAPQLCCDFRKAYIHRLRVTYNFGYRALYSLPWRASVNSHQVQCNIPPFETYREKMCTCFL